MALPGAAARWHGWVVTAGGSLATRLGSTWFGAGLSSHARERLAALAELREVDPGAVLLREGADTERFGGLLRGLLRDDEALALTLYPRLLESVSRRLTATRTQLLDLYARDREYEPW